VNLQKNMSSTPASLQALAPSVSGVAWTSLILALLGFLGLLFVLVYYCTGTVVNPELSAPNEVHHMRDASEGAADCTFQKRMSSRTVISLTTIPARLQELEPTLESLMKQTIQPDRVYLCLPHSSVRFPEEKYEVPPWLRTFQQRHGHRFCLLRCEDHGPLTKLLPVLQQETAPDTLLILADDDQTYHPRALERLYMQSVQHPSVAWGYRGLRWTPAGDSAYERSNERGGTDTYVLGDWSVDLLKAASYASQVVDVLETYSGVVYRRCMFDAVQLSDVPLEHPCWYCDDLWIAHHLKQRGVPRLLLNDQAAEHDGNAGSLKYPIVRRTQTAMKAPLAEQNFFVGTRNADCWSALSHNALPDKP